MSARERSSRYRRIALPLAAALCLMACTMDQAGGHWQSRADGRPPDMGQTLDCHAQASRLAAARYPDQAQRNPDGTVYRISNPDSFSAEIRLYESCLQTKGYVRSDK
jgi:hypothetical protein